MGLAVRETGGEGEPLVLLHGFGGTHRAWDRVVAALGQGTRVLAYDLPGHGGSLDFPEAGPAPVAARAIVADLQARGFGRFHLAGHSFGGAVAALIAMRAPGQVASMTLFAPGGFGPEINAPLLKRYAEARTPDEVEACLILMSGPGCKVPSDVVEAAMAMRAQPGQVSMLRRIWQMIAGEGSQGTLPRDGLAGLDLPVRVVWGGFDAVLPPRQSDDLPPLFARHFFPGLGHMLPEEAPADMARILQFAICRN